jgi:polyhydroxybutyrate depolymerase
MKKQLLLPFLCWCSVTIAQTATPIKDSILSGGIYRKYTLYVPNVYAANKAVPLVFNIHGGTGNGDQQMEFGDFRRIADTANFIVVHPTALGNPPNWAVGGSISSGEADRTFLLNLLDTLKLKYTIDASRVYSAGFSQGGIMGYDFACLQNMNFAAIASVSGGISKTSFAACAPTRPTPVMEIHGTSDLIAGYNGTSTLLTTLPPFTHIDTIVKYWVNFNHCDTAAKVFNLANTNTKDNCTVVHYVYSGGYQNASVEFYKVISGGHAWPADTATGGTKNASGSPMMLGNRNMDFNASKEIWRFFNQYKLLATGISEQLSGSTNQVNIFPNPSNGLITIQLEKAEQLNIQLYNLVGALVFEEKISGNNNIVDVNYLTKGVYFYSLKNKDGIVKNGKLIVQ